MPAAAVRPAHAETTQESMACCAMPTVRADQPRVERSDRSERLIYAISFVIVLVNLDEQDDGYHQLSTTAGVKREGQLVTLRRDAHSAPLVALSSTWHGESSLQSMSATGIGGKPSCIVSASRSRQQ